MKGTKAYKPPVFKGGFDLEERKMNTKKADIVVSSNAVFTGLTDIPEFASIAIVNNKIAAIGSKGDCFLYRKGYKSIFFQFLPANILQSYN